MKGLAGWNIGSSPVFLMDHVEEIVPSNQQPNILPSNMVTSRADRHDETMSLFNESLYLPGTNISTLGDISENIDLVLATAGEGPQTISRSFKTKKGVKNVTVRYRFVTTEIPGGYFGTKYNDYYSVAIRCATGGSVVESNSMNGLGLGAFTSGGSTDWREYSLKTDPNGENIQVNLSVANVADGYLPSYVVIDLIEEDTLAISSMSLNDIDSSSLSFLSSGTHNYFNGHSRIHGVVTVEGVEDDKLESLELDVLQNGAVVATAPIIESLEGSLYQEFGDDAKVEVS